MEPRDLYGLPLDRFTAERTALAKELRKAGRRDEAESVTKLRKPSLAAWAVNQLVRTQGRAVSELFTAGDDVQKAQSDLLSGGGRSEALRDALAHERRAVRELVGVARGLLNSNGHELGPATLERVSETLEAAALEAEARVQVQEGCLDRELRHVGLGAPPPAGAPTTPPPGAATKPSAKPRRGGRSARARATPPPPPPSALRRREAETRRAVGRAARELKIAQAARDAAADKLAAADAALGRAQEQAEHAEEAHRRAEEELRSGG